MLEISVENIVEKGRNCSPQEQFLLLSTIFYYLVFDFCVKTRIRFSLRDKWLFEITEVEITRVDLFKVQTALDNLKITPYIACLMIFLVIFEGNKNGSFPGENIPFR